MRPLSRILGTLALTVSALFAADAPRPNVLFIDLRPALTAPSEAPPRARHFWRVGAEAAFREGEWKIQRGRGASSWQLFHLREDPAEEHDLATAQPNRLAALETAWQKLDTEMIAPLWGGPTPSAK